MSKEVVAHEELLRVLRYEKDTGEFFWKVDSAGGRRHKPGPVGCKCKKHGYIRIRVGKKMYLAHRLAWFYVHGVWPRFIDHRNGCTWDNRIENLRDVSLSENQQNRAMPSTNKSGAVGVSWHSQAGKWLAQITVNRVHYSLGLYETVGDASAAYARAKSSFHTYYPTVRGCA